MIMENMKLILDANQLEILQSEENKLELKMQKQLMELGSFSDGTILTEIQRINKYVSDKLGMQLDLASKGLFHGSDAAQDLSKQEQQEKKLDEYMIKFIRLNSSNEKILNDFRSDMDKALQKQQEWMFMKMNENMKELSKLALEEE